MKLYIATPINARQEPTMREKLVAAKHRVEMLKVIRFRKMWNVFGKMSIKNNK